MWGFIKVTFFFGSAAGIVALGQGGGFWDRRPRGQAGVGLQGRAVVWFRFYSDLLLWTRLDRQGMVRFAFF